MILWWGAPPRKAMWSLALDQLLLFVISLMSRFISFQRTAVGFFHDPVAVVLQNLGTNMSVNGQDDQFC